MAFLAYATHKANGHATFKQGEIGTALGRFDEDGTFVPLDRRAVWRAIQEAIDFDLLAPDSKTLCLVVPGHRISGGLGDEHAPCRRHPKRQSATRSLRAVS
ncbi:hypothetical protein [Nocardioides jishulii]|uniref:Uncharacterized protein n=1 Tax=Nocardioides jishulii TaxID=2575440 RepID=A0A4U2YJS9_9ACTN|nr:hypothetical protein [Nocardioides jishulii]QCX28081.1 hypothetical protein FCL41_11550 [Nocardioides jishulii]TKI60745.1 hypothetical protein FC770_14625 [Nocardioides jishulii]